MGLQVWLPLIENVNNQGLSSITTTNNGATINDNGKIGKCYYFDGSDDYINLGTSIGNYFDGSAFSICFWIKSLEDGTRGCIFSSYSLPSTSDFFSLEINSGSKTDNSLRFDWKGGDVFYSNSNTFSVSEWIHICVTYDGAGNLKMYKNGDLAYTKTYNLTAITTGNTYYLGRDSRTGATAFNGYLNDFRLYNHALSPKEVKLISQGLILHYPLNRGGFGQDNHYQNSNFSTGATSYWYGVNGSSISVVVKDGKNTITGMKGTNSNIFGQTIDDYSYVANSSITFTISADIYVEENGTLSIGNWITTTQASGWQSMPSTSVVWNKPNTLQVGWNKISVTKKGCTNQYDGKIVTAFGYTGTTFYATNIKFEFGEKQTPWIPNTADVEYSTLGFDDGIEYDVSGYQHNGTKNGTITYSSDTARYNVSSVFNGTVDISTTNPLPNPCAEFTVAGWINLIEGYAANYGFHIISFDATYCRICISKDNRAIRVLLTDGTTSYTGSSTAMASSLTSGVWNHYAITFKDGSIKLYINGVLDSSITATITSVGFTTSILRIGRYSTENPKAKASDIRLYSVALSADDILELYNTPITLSQNGTLLTQGGFQE